MTRTHRLFQTVEEEQIAREKRKDKQKNERRTCLRCDDIEMRFTRGQRS